MKLMLAAGMLLMSLAAASCDPTGAQISAQLELTNAPPPPAVYFDREPQWTYLPDCGVYVLADDAYDYDMFLLGGWYYVYNAGYWYRADQPRGPFVVIEERRVPRRIFTVSNREYHWRRHPMAWKTPDHDHGHGHGHGDDREHDRDHDRNNDR
jgi:hypothetical protein